MFGTRLISGIVLIIIAILALSLGGPALAGILLVISLIAYRELTKVLKVSGENQASPGREKEDKRLNLLEIIGMTGIIIYYTIAFFLGTEVLLLMCIVGVFMAMMFSYVVAFPKYRAEHLVGAFFSFMYAPVMLSFVYLTRMCPQGIYMVWMIIISSWGCDTCAYVVGMLIGKKKIFPRLSPKKSLEGCIGGVLGAALLGGWYGYFFVEPLFPDQTVMWIIAFICGVGAVMSQIGDLAASAIKRNAKIKDYGKLIPGHGGIMDRFDSMIVTAPMIYFLTILMIRF